MKVAETRPKMLEEVAMMTTVAVAMPMLASAAWAMMMMDAAAEATAAAMTAATQRSLAAAAAREISWAIVEAQAEGAETAVVKDALRLIEAFLA